MPRLAVSILIIILIALPSLFASPGFAQDDKAASQELVIMEAYGDVNAACHEWSDGCRVCRRRGAEEPACSTPGIACTPHAIVCEVAKPK